MALSRRETLPALDEQVKTVKVKNPIIQEFHGTFGTYTQANIEKQRSYNLPQWKALCDESNHQPPARRGERRRNQEKATRAAPSRAKKPMESTSTGPAAEKRGPGRPRVRPLPTTVHKHDGEGEDEQAVSHQQTPPTPRSPPQKPPKSTKVKKEQLSDDEVDGPQQKSVSSRRQHNHGAQADVVDEEAFKSFDYRIHNQDEWTSERCQELETAYWKSLNFNNPLYGADMPGSLFDDGTESWNVAKLENLLDVLGQKVPGVNTAYLYLGMWKATFAWHLEDVDLYSINYIHFGAPKQWYSISQADARRFEAAMRSEYYLQITYRPMLSIMQMSGPLTPRPAINSCGTKPTSSLHNYFSPSTTFVSIGSFITRANSLSPSPMATTLVITWATTVRSQ